MQGLRFSLGSGGLGCGHQNFGCRASEIVWKSDTGEYVARSLSCGEGFNTVTHKETSKTTMRLGNPTSDTSMR